MINKTISLTAIIANGAVVEIAVLRDTELNTDAELDQSGYAVGKFLKAIGSPMFISGLGLAIREFTKFTCGRGKVKEASGEAE